MSSERDADATATAPHAERQPPTWPPVTCTRTAAATDRRGGHREMRSVHLRGTRRRVCRRRRGDVGQQPQQHDDRGREQRHAERRHHPSATHGPPAAPGPARREDALAARGRARRPRARRPTAPRRPPARRLHRAPAAVPPPAGGPGARPLGRAAAGHRPSPAAPGLRGRGGAAAPSRAVRADPPHSVLDLIAPAPPFRSDPLCRSPFRSAAQRRTGVRTSSPRCVPPTTDRIEKSARVVRTCVWRGAGIGATVVATTAEPVRASAPVRHARTVPGHSGNRANRRGGASTWHRTSPAGRLATTRAAPRAHRPGEHVPRPRERPRRPHSPPAQGAGGHPRLGRAPRLPAERARDRRRRRPDLDLVGAPPAARPGDARATCGATPTARARSTSARPTSTPEAPPSESGVAERPAPAFVPLLGTIAAGGPILAEQAVESVFPLPREIVGEGTLFLLRVAR